MKIALLPGGFKPPHLGHYNMAKYLADFADKVIIRIGQKEREGIGKELALEIWSFYKEFDPDPRAKKLIISVAQSPSPVRDVYDFVEQTAPEGSTIILGLGEKDASDGRYNSIPKFAEPRNIKADIELVPPQAGGISGTRMREIIKSNSKEEFFKFIPDYLPEEIKEEIWTKLLDTTMPQDVEEMVGGTMNKQEMDKHNANMKKLSKHLSKVNSQGNMVPVPRNLTKGLRRKLYEGRYDAETLLISRFIIDMFKDEFGKDYEDTFEEIGKLRGSDKEEKNAVPYDLELYFYPTDSDTLGPNAFVINGQADEDTVVIQINYNPEGFPAAYNDLIAEVKDTLRHELEHVGQYAFGKEVEPDGTDPKDVPLSKYLTLDFEIPSFVQGLYKTAKTKKITLTQAIDDFLEEREAELTPEEAAKVKQIWINWAKENLPAAQLENYPPYKANQVQQTRYKSSDTFTRDPKKSKKLGYTEGKDPKVGTGKKPKGSGRRLYTDENPSDTVKVKFSTRQDIVDTLNKSSFKSKSHARQSQVINLIHQRVRAALNRAKDPDVKKRLRPAFEYIKKRKEASKKKTERLKKLKEGDTYEKMAAKGKKSGNLKQGTVRKRLNIPKGKKIPLSLINKEISRLKKMEKRSEKNQKYYKALTLAKTLKTTTNVNEKELTKKELKDRERIAKDLPDSEFKKRYGKDWKSVKIATATKMAKKMEEQKLFSKEWWSDVIIEELLNEGGAAGHMAHPFDLPNVTTGKDLIKSFEVAADSLKKEPGAVKIDGVNASIRLLNNAGKREFAMDRGSKKALDLRGVTKADLEDRFGPGHGMIKAGGNVLDIFNAALPSTEEELNALGLLNDPNIMFNMEYVSGKSNVQDYGKNFLAIHGLLSIESKEVQGARKMLTKRITTEKNFDQADMDEYLKKLEPFAKKRGFEIFGSVPTTFTKEPDFKSVLGTNYTIDFAEGSKTKSLAQWLNDVNDIPKTDRLKMNVEGIPHGGTKDVGALSKQVYFAVFGGENVDDLFDNDQDIQKAVQGATTYLATEKLGDAILDVLDSPMGSVNDHEGVVIRDPKVSPKPYKITGKFITGGVSSDFQKK